MAATKKRPGGKRLAKNYEQKRKAYRAYSRAQTVSGSPSGSRSGKRAVPASRQEKRRLWQLVVSAAILIAVIGVKLISPQTLEQFRGQLLELMGSDTDFVEVFSAVGRAVGMEDGIGNALNNAYVAVFGNDSSATQPAETGAAVGLVLYDDDTLPENVCLTQKVLGFAYVSPVEGTLNDRFGYREHPIEGVDKFHYGLDIQADEGTVIGSFADGTVTVVGESSALGKYVTVLHEGGYTTLYAHCSRVTASSGQQVKMSDPIAEVGQTGQATGPHLHFELHLDTLYLNPVYYVSC